MFKKALSLILSLMLIITSLSVTAFSVNAAPEDDIKYVVGGTANLCDESWSFTEESGNIMTEKEDGTYELVFSPTEALGTVQIKVAKLTNGEVANDDDYYGDATGNNITFIVKDGGDVIVKFDPSTKKVTVTGDHVELVTQLKIDSMRVVGGGDGNWLNGVNWDPADDSNLMTETSSGVYEITYEDIDAFDNYQFKFAANGSWTDNWGGDFESTTAEYNGGNIVAEVEEDGSTVKLVLDLTNFDYSTKKGAIYKVFVNGVQVNGQQATEPETTEPVATEPQETTTVSTTAAPETTAAPAAGLNVKATSNFFPEFTKSFENGADEVTVTYYINSEKRMLESQLVLTYDPSVLKFNADKNVDDEDKWAIMPQAKNAVCNPFIAEEPGTIRCNCTDVNLYKLQTKNGEDVPFVTVTFDVIGSGDTTVNLDLQAFTIGYPDANTKQLDPATEEEVVLGSVVLPYTTPIKTYTTVTGIASTNPTTVPVTTAEPTEPTTTEPVTTEPTTTEPVTTEPTTTEPTTTIPSTTVSDSLTVKATSNLFPEVSKHYDPVAKTVTVTYYINSVKSMLETQWKLTYDPSVLKFNADKNVDDEDKWTIMPQAKDAVCNPFIDDEPGTIRGNCTNVYLYKLQTKDGNEVPFVKVTFDVIGNGETTVDLLVEALTVGYTDPATKMLDEATEEAIVDGSQLLPHATPVYSNTEISDVEQPTTEPATTEPVTTEPATTEPATTEPVTTEPVTTEPVTTEPSSILDITATSNLFPASNYKVDFADNGVKVVTVTYYFQSEKDILDTQWKLSYDTNYLKLKTTDKFMPFADDTAAYNTSVAGEVKGNVSNVYLFDFSEKKPFVRATFEALQPGETTVDLYVDDLNVSVKDPQTGLSDDAQESTIIINGDNVQTDFDIIVETEIMRGEPVVPPTEPGTTEPATTEPATTEPATTEPATTEPATTEPATTEPATTEPATTEPATTEPATTEPATTEPATTEPATTEPATTEPATTEPVTTEPATTEPATTEPAITEPGTTEPGTTEPGTTEPGTTAPGAADSTSATDTTSGGNSTADQSTSDTTKNQGSGTVQTGNVSMALIILAVLVSATGVIYFARKRTDK